MTTLSIVIPVYNEVSTIDQLLDQVWKKNLSQIEKQIIIVESRSSDGSREICERFALEKNKTQPGGVRLILQDRPSGKGAAVREGLAAATGDIILIQDADLEYSVDDYDSLLQPLLQGKSDFVLGSRHLATGGWKIRQFEKNPYKAMILNFGGVLFHSLFNILYGQKLTDPTTMYKVFRRSCIRDLRFYSNRFDFDFELLAKLILAGYRPLEVPVSYSSRSFAEGKKIRVFRDPLTWVIAMLRFRWPSPFAHQNEREPVPK